MNFISFLFRWKDLTQPSVIFEGGLRAIFYSICSLVYKMIFHVYNIFLSLCNGQLLETDQLTNLFSRIGLLLGIVMSFRVALSFIQALIDPDSAFDSKKGVPGIIKKVILVIIMFGMSQYAFDLSRDLQVMIIKNDVIPNLVLPAEVNTENFGGALTANLFTAFYNVDPAVEKATNIEDQNCKDTYIAGLQTTIANNNDFSYMKNICLNSTATFAAEDGSDDEDFIIYFNFIFCLITGVFVLWFLFNYCIQVGMRIIQLTVLQIISPMAFIGYLSPTEDGTFKKWWKLYLSTYVDVFIRIAIIDFVCYLCALIMVNWNSGGGIFWSSVGSPEGFTRKLIGVFMILALFTFAKKAPDLIKTLFPSTAGTALGFGTNKENFKPLGVAGAAAIGGIAGGVTSGFSRAVTNRNQGRSRLTGFASGLMMGTGRGALTAGRNGHLIKGFGAAMNANRDADNKHDELVAGGGSTMGMIGARVMDQFGLTKGGDDSRQIARYQRVIDTNKKLQDIAEGFREVKTAKAKWETARIQGAGQQQLDKLWKEYKDIRRNKIDQALKDPSDRNSFENAEERSLAAQISMEQGNLQSYYNANNMSIRIEKTNADGTVERDAEGNIVYLTLTDKSFNSAKIFEEASFVSSSAQTEIMKSDEYAAAKANAEAAGAVGKRSGGN